MGEYPTYVLQPGAFLAVFFSSRCQNKTCFNVFAILQKQFGTGISYIDVDWKVDIPQIGLIFSGWAKVQ